SDKRVPHDYAPVLQGLEPEPEWLPIGPGRATLGVDRSSIPFGWDNEFPACTADVGAFALERHDVTNERFLEFVEAGGYRDERWWDPGDWQWIRTERIGHPHFWSSEEGRWHWRGMFSMIPLP